MLVVGGVSLFACLFLPALLEYRAARREHAAKSQQVAYLEEENRRADKQKEHLERDAAYIERLHREEFGTGTPGVEIIPVETRASGSEQPDSALSPTDATSSEDVATAVEHAAHENPLMAVFVLEQTRPIVMAMSGVVIVVALVLLMRRRPA